MRLVQTALTVWLPLMTRLLSGVRADDSSNYDDEYNVYAAGYEYLDSIDYLDPGADCSIDADGRVQINGSLPACNLILGGVSHTKRGLAEGLNGLYELKGCHDEMPMYTRSGIMGSETPVLWYSREFWDWDISLGQPHAEDILAYGGGHGQPSRPEQGSWKIAADYVLGYNGTEDYVPVNLTLSCADDARQQPSGAEPADAPHHHRTGLMLGLILGLSLALAASGLAGFLIILAVRRKRAAAAQAVPTQDSQLAPLLT